MSHWWEREGLECRDGRLRIAGRDAEELARTHGTPLFVFDLDYAVAQLRALQHAFQGAGLRHCVRVSMKALRTPEFLAAVRAMGRPGSPESVGLDASSPQEAVHGLANGLLPQEISLTGTNLSDEDLALVVDEDIHVNVDLVSQIRRIGRLSPGRRIGIRVNPKCGYVNPRVDHSITLYSGEAPTKFGIYEEDLPLAVATAHEHAMTIDTAHFHVFNGILTDDLPAVGEALAHVRRHVELLIELGCPIAEINVGGGLGIPWHPGQRPLDLDAWAGLLAGHLGDLGAVISCEPGEYVSMQSAVLLAEAITVEERLGHLFAGLNVGWNVCAHRFVYKIDLNAIHTTRAGDRSARSVTFSGNINEGPDLFVEDLPFPAVEEGDIVALYPAGAYTLSNYHPHCLRPPGRELYLSRTPDIAAVAGERARE